MGCHRVHLVRRDAARGRGSFASLFLAFSRISRSSSLTFTQSLQDPNRVLNMCWLVSHETSHMWFGDLATGAWWNQMWLNVSSQAILQSLVIYALH